MFLNFLIQTTLAASLLLQNEADSGLFGFDDFSRPDYTCLNNSNPVRANNLINPPSNIEEMSRQHLTEHYIAQFELHFEFSFERNIGKLPFEGRGKRIPWVGSSWHARYGI